MDIGIDLGTTFSAIAVKGKVQLAAGYPPGQYLEQCDVTVIPTPFGEMTVPSVLWAEPGSRTEMLIGSEAKQKAENGESPIMFSKRNIGTSKPLKIGNRTYSAMEVATHILSYLKSCAEQALGQPVGRAVITHPAYFDRNQVEETRQAAEAAGLDMSLPEQLLMEPAAAALAFLREETKDPLRVMAYDLGGGTFDVTILERREGIISLKAFDGDPLLGGYNFDRELVQWLVNRLKEAGRIIPYDDQDARDRGRHARLLHLAESAKIELSKQRTDKMPVQITAPDVLVDDQGRKVQIHERITREQYVALIKEHLDHTVDCCRKALAKAAMKPDELDGILLVGGSCHGPWVAEALAQAFASVPVRKFEPDLCVAAGAALQAAELPPVAAGGGLELLLEVPPTFALRMINLGGRVRASGGKPLTDAVRELQVFLKTPLAGTLSPAKLKGSDGRFGFDDVELMDGAPTEFSIHVTDAKGVTRLSKTFTVHYQPDATDTVISTSLPKPLYLMTADGMRLLAEEGRQLPAKCEVPTAMVRGDRRVEIPVYQEDVEVGKVIVENIPPGVGEGSPVVVTVEITEKNEMRGEARVLQRGSGAVVAQCPIYIKFPPLALPDVGTLWAKLDKLENKRLETLEESTDPVQRMELEGRARKLSQSVRKKFDELKPDEGEIHQRLRELERLVDPPEHDMHPPRAKFRELVDGVREALAMLSSAEQDALRNTLARIEADGNEAYAEKNPRKWTIANENLMALVGRLQKVGGGGGPDELPPTPILKDEFRHNVEALRVALKQRRDELAPLPTYTTQIKPWADDIATAIDRIEAAIDKVPDDFEPRRALSQLVIAIRPEEQLARQIRELGYSVRSLPT